MTNDPTAPATSASIHRRTVLRGASAAAAMGAVSPVASAIGGQESDATRTLKIGIVGLGGRGRGAIFNALQADANTKLHAISELFADRLESGLEMVEKEAANRGIEDRIDVPEERRFSGFEGYKQVIDACDVVLFASTPHFRPAQVEYAVQKRKHMFVEKPVATDSTGLRRIWKACDEAKDLGIALVTGLCYRYSPAKIASVQKTRELVGDIHAVECSYDTQGLWHRGEKPEWSEMETQLRNWLYYTWASGDHVAEQAIHNLDKMLWVLGDVMPTKVKAQGGRIVRTEAKYGNVFDHFSAVFSFESGIKGFFSCRQWVNGHRDVSDHVYGTKGTGHLMRHRVEGKDGKSMWRYRAEEGVEQDMYNAEHNAMFASIRAGKPIHDGDIMCRATLAALMVRMSAYTGKELTAEQVLNSEEDLAPKEYSFGPNPVQPVAQPGVTPFV